MRRREFERVRLMQGSSADCFGATNRAGWTAAMGRPAPFSSLVSADRGSHPSQAASELTLVSAAIGHNRSLGAVRF